MKVSPMKGFMRFSKKRKLEPRHIDPYRISKRFDNFAYELELSLGLAEVHPVFHISMLKKCLGDPALIVPMRILILRKIYLMRIFPFIFFAS